MNNVNTEKAKCSSIQKFYSGKTIFVTGATGFLGKVLIEKLLRECADIEKIYVLMRSKKGKDSRQRFAEYFEDTLFDTLKKINSKSIEKVSIIAGDLKTNNLGLTETDIETIISEVNCIFHVAASIRFINPLRDAVRMNLQSTMDILALSKRIRNLKCLVHVSTAYSFCDRDEIDEKIYEVPMKAEDLIWMVNTIDETRLKAMTPILVGEYKNTYVFTKALTEDFLLRNFENVPIAIVRPSAVFSTAKEPIPGWINNHNACPGIFYYMNLGLLHVVKGDNTKIIDLIPVDYVVNNMIAVGWEIGYNQPQLTGSVPVYNCTSHSQNPITWEMTRNFLEKYDKKVPLNQKLWHSFTFWTQNPLINAIFHFVGLFFAYLIDVFNFGKRTRAVLLFKQMETFMSVFDCFLPRQWYHKNNNVQNLWKKLSPEDKELFEFDISKINWDSFFHDFVVGMRVHYLKDPLNTVTQARKRAKTLKLIHYAIQFFFALCFLCIIFYIATF